MRKNLLPLLLVPLFYFSCKEDEKKPAVNDTPTKMETPVKVLPPITHYTVPDHSPMDMIYFPADYPLQKQAHPSCG